MSAPSLVRLFIAAHLPGPVRADLVRAAAPLRAALPNVRWVRGDLLHLTLVFLGERPVGQVEAISGALEAACKEQEFFVLGLGRNGCFPSAERARVLWTGLAGHLAALLALRRAVVIALAAAELTGEEARFFPHLTIGRLREGVAPSERAEVGRRWLDLPALPAAFIPIDQIHLMRSDLTPGGPHYTTLRSIALTRDM